MRDNRQDRTIQRNDGMGRVQAVKTGKLKQDRYKTKPPENGRSKRFFTPPPPHFFNYFNNLGDFFRKSGFSLTELLVAIGIVTTVSGTAVVSYMKYHDRAKLLQLYQTGQEFFKAVQACRLIHDSMRDCAGMNKLKFKCGICQNDVWFDNTRIRIKMEVDGYRSTAIWREDYLPHPAIRIQKAKGTPLKFCSNHHTDMQGNNIGSGSVKLPLRKCSNNNDCESDEHCFAPSLPFWTADGPWTKGS